MIRRRGLGIARNAARTAGRTALIAGTATAVTGRVAQRQRRQPEPQTPRHEPDMVERLQQLADLRASGALSDKEFAAAKAKLLAI